MKIPSMTHPLSLGWRQPPRESIAIIRDLALVKQADFDKLVEYSGSIPTGVYPGKMWKLKIGKIWFLCWYGDTEVFIRKGVRQARCPIYRLEIRIVKEGKENASA